MLTRQDLHNNFPRIDLLDGPTPIQRMRRLEEQLQTGVQIYVKRDDFMAVGLGGNKLRKLEYLLGDALHQGCDTFITTGGLQSNHARLSAAASARAGLACELMLTQMVANDSDAYQQNGNMLLDPLFGARVHLFEAGVDALQKAQERARELEAQGRRAYAVGLGGSSTVGTMGYVDCAAEILEQEAQLGLRFDRIVTATGSAGTHAGLAVGLSLLGDDASRVQAFSVLSRQEAIQTRTRALIAEMVQRLAPGTPAFQEVVVDDSQLGEGYGIPTPAMQEALRLVARSEGWLLDPVYSGKAFAGLLAAVRSGQYQDGDAVLFLMTGGAPGVFAYCDALRV